MPKEIAWIEDDIDIISPVVRPLELDGYQFLKFRNATDADNAIEQIRRSDLVLLDMLLPVGQKGQDIEDYEGLRLLRDWRKAYKTKFPPVVAFTVITSDRIVSELRQLKVAGIVGKPVRPSELKKYLLKILQAETGK
jgi:CheY-like chemotaxis protein